MTSDAVSISLAHAVDEGLLERTKGGYRFGHDKVQSCFQSMLSSSERTRVHKVMGEWFLDLGDP